MLRAVLNGCSILSNLLCKPNKLVGTAAGRSLGACILASDASRVHKFWLTVVEGPCKERKALIGSKVCGEFELTGKILCDRVRTCGLPSLRRLSIAFQIGICTSRSSGELPALVQLRQGTSYFIYSQQVVVASSAQLSALGVSR